MKSSTILLSVALAAVRVHSFTNGTVVPAYICNAVADGLPKSFGELLPITRKNQGTIAVSPNAGQNVKLPSFTANGTSMVGNSAYILSSFHNTINSLAAIPQGITLSFNNATTGAIGTIKAGQANTIFMQSADPNFCLDGVLIYAQNAAGKRMGSFTDMSGNNIFVPFPGCGVNEQGALAGVIQQQLVSDTASFSQLVYNAPACVQPPVLTVAGLSVTDSGFGVYKYNVTVTGSNCAGPSRTRHHPRV